MFREQMSTSALQWELYVCLVACATGENSTACCHFAGASPENTALAAMLPITTKVDAVTCGMASVGVPWPDNCQQGTSCVTAGVYEVLASSQHLAHLQCGLELQL